MEVGQWTDFCRAIQANDVERVIEMATPEFVSGYNKGDGVLWSFCMSKCKFDGDARVVPHLIANGAKVTSDMLRAATYSKRVTLFKALLLNGFKPNDPQCDVPLDYYARNWNFEIVKLLVDFGGELRAEKSGSIQAMIDFRKAARLSAIAIIGVGREKRPQKDVYAIIARSVWSQRFY